MRLSPSLAFLAAALVGASLGACNCAGNAGFDVATEMDSGVMDPSADGSTRMDTDGGLCLVANQPCTAGSGLSCCDGVCDNGSCRALCQPLGGSCSDTSPCCGGVQCNGGTCSGPKCVDTGAACTSGAQCCTGLCGASGRCEAIPGAGSCKVLGSSCGGGAECCSTLCRFGACAVAASCRAYDDVCFGNSQCCSGLCSVTDGGAGYCVKPTGGTGCNQSGNPCTDGTNCCTKVCADLGTGAKVCQAVGGCRVAGDFCPAASSCCGGIPSGGSVDCTSNNRCDNGQACRAPGTICGKPVELDGGQVRTPDGGIFTVNNETNCCNGYKVMGDEQTCRLDSSGVPRCFGGGSSSCPSGFNGSAGCCIAQGNACDFEDQCCDGALCVAPTDGGVRRCEKPTCSTVGTLCTDSSTCCAGTECLATSELTKACQIPPNASVMDAGTCKPNATSCSAGNQCCSGICSGNQCAAAAACQGSAGACSGPQDCCAGLTCNIPSGSTSGSCAAGALCSGLGQTCGPSTACCSSLACKSTTSGLPCDGSTACACQVTIN